MLNDVHVTVLYELSAFVLSVAAGVDHLKHGRLTEAMQMFNKALQIDSDNVEALVARGALYVWVCVFLSIGP